MSKRSAKGAAAVPPRLSLAEVEARLGHQFRDPARLEEALSHGSVVGRLAARTNQRFEFLGDRVVGLVIAAALLERFPEADEGGVAHRFVALTSGQAMASVAGRLDLAQAVRIDPSVAGPGGEISPAVLEDACEALMGAIFADAGFAAARAVILRLWAPLFGEVAEIPRDAKSALQELAMARGWPVPNYRLVERVGPSHDSLFTVEVSVSGHGPVAGQARSKRKAEFAAAAALLQQLEA